MTKAAYAVVGVVIGIGLLGARRSGRFFIPSLPKDGRHRLIGLPIEEIIKAGPGMDLAIANLTPETARTLL
jgi:hypothetical protein